MTTSLDQQGVRPKTIIDVGANVGQFAVAAAKTFASARVVSFEPNPEAFRKLVGAAQKLGVECVQRGVGEGPGLLELHVHSSSASSSFLRTSATHERSFPHSRPVKDVQVEVCSLDDFFVGRSLERPILLKIDVQGFEPAVIRGAKRLLREVDYILLELSFDPLYEGESTFLTMQALMADAGWQLLRPVDFLRDRRTRQILQVDGLFVPA